MAQHGYLGDDYGTEYDPDYDPDDRERGTRRSNWRDDRDFMFDEGRGRSDRDDRHRRPFGNMGDDARSWFRDKPDGEPGRLGGRESDRWRDSDAAEWFGGSASTGRRARSSQDDHYRSWRDRHMQALDRDYEDYCREREQQFHQDFDSWRKQRRGNPEPLRAGMTQTGLSEDPSGLRQAENEADQTPSGGSDPLATATVGTNSRGRGRSGSGLTS